MEVGVLAELVDQVRQLLAARRDDAPADELTELTGIRTAPATRPEDPVLARLLPDFVAEDADLSGGLRVLHEPDLLAAKDAAAAAVLDSLPPGGGTVRIDPDVAGQWLAALNDLRLALGVRLELTDDEVPAAVTRDPQGPTAATYGVYRWLSYLQESLVEALAE